jgi:hypothetical protein
LKLAVNPLFELHDILAVPAPKRRGLKQSALCLLFVEILLQAQGKWAAIVQHYEIGGARS